MWKVKEMHYVHSLRCAELAVALENIAQDEETRVLEIGGADGFIAAKLARRFGNIESVDIDVSSSTYFPVREFGGDHLPFAGGMFSLIYSSHVMEHIVNFDAFQTELARVLRSGGICIHVMPSATWRIWTLLAHYPALPKLAWAALSGRLRPSFRRENRDCRYFEPVWWLRQILFATRHGEHGSVLQELWRFSRMAWSRRFRALGWEVTAVRSLGLFYTGYNLCGSSLDFESRRRLARLLGSSSIAYLLRPQSDVNENGRRLL